VVNHGGGPCARVVFYTRTVAWLDFGMGCFAASRWLLEPHVRIACGAAVIGPLTATTTHRSSSDAQSMRCSSMTTTLRLCIRILSARSKRSPYHMGSGQSRSDLLTAYIRRPACCLPRRIDVLCRTKRYSLHRSQASERTSQLLTQHSLLPTIVTRPKLFQPSCGRGSAATTPTSYTPQPITWSSGRRSIIKTAPSHDLEIRRPLATLWAFFPRLWAQRRNAVLRVGAHATPCFAATALNGNYRGL
jgi:hypothetical protein